MNMANRQNLTREQYELFDYVYQLLKEKDLYLANFFLTEIEQYGSLLGDENMDDMEDDIGVLRHTVSIQEDVISDLEMETDKLKTKIRYLEKEIAEYKKTQEFFEEQ